MSKATFFWVPCVIAAFSMSSSQATLIAWDSFATSAGGVDYDLGSIENQNPTVGLSGFTGAWNGGTGALVATSGGLTHDLSPGQALSGQIIAATSSGGASRRLSRAIDYTPSDGTYYMSALLENTEPTTTRDIFVGLGPLESPTLSFGNSQSTYIGIHNGALDFSSGGSFSELLAVDEVAVGETYFVLMQIDFSTSGDETVVATIFDSSSTQVAHQVFNGLELDGKIGRLSLATISFSTTVVIDEWRFGTELSDVMVLERLAGDYTDNGLVEQGDLDLVLLNWGAGWPPVVDGWLNDRPTDGTINQNDLDKVLLNWGTSAVSTNEAAVPEPATWMLLSVLTILTVKRYGYRRAVSPRLAQ